MPYAQICPNMAIYAIFGHMAYGISACHMRHVGWPGTQWDVPIEPVKTRPKLHCRNKSYAKNTFLVILPSENKSKASLSLEHYVIDKTISKHVLKGVFFRIRPFVMQDHVVNKVWS
jgi:hypothetical protein